jgi:hypothetical protein
MKKCSAKYADYLNILPKVVSIKQEREIEIDRVLIVYYTQKMSIII